MSSRTIRHTTHPAALTLMMVLLLVTVGCEINSPEMPSFDTTLMLPLGTERLEILDIIEDEDFLMVTADGSLGFHLDGEPDTLGLNFDLSVDIPGQSVDQGLGEFALPAPAPLSYEFQLGDIWAPAAGANGVVVLVPPFPINVNSSGQDIPDVVSATLSEGLLTITITNNLPVIIGADSGSDQIILDLENPADGTPVATIAFPRIRAGETSTRTADLAGVILPDAVAVRLTGGSPGSASSPTLINGTDAIAIDAAFSGLVVSAATAVVGSQTFTTSFDTALPADYEITRAIIASGAVDLSLSNNMPIPSTVVLSWDQVLDIDGMPLSRTFQLAAGATADATFDFAGYTVQADGVPLTNLTATLAVDTPGSSGLPVTMSAGDGLSAALSAGALSFSSVTGLVPAFTVPLEPITESIDLPDEMSGIELTAARLTLTVINSAGIPAALDLIMTGTAASGDVRTLVVNEQILPSVSRAPTTTTIVLDETNSGILNFLNNLPETITLSGDVIAGGDGATGTVHVDDFAVLAWDISAPVEIAITGATLDSDPEPLDIDTDLRENIATHARGAVLRTEILNHLPLAVQLRIVAAQDTNQLATTPLLSVGPITVAAGLVDPVSHTVSQPVTSTPVISLTTEQAQIFGLPGLFTRVEVILPSTEGQPVRIMSTDYLEFQGIVELEVLVDDQL